MDSRKLNIAGHGPRLVRSERHIPNLYDIRNGGKLATLLKVETSRSSLQAVNVGEKTPPFDMAAIYDFQVSNIHHSVAINAKRRATLGLGFTSQKTVDVLNELSDDNWQNVADALAQDYWMTGTGYLEVVREGDKIVGLYHIKSRDIRLYIEDEFYNRHYFLEGAEGTFGQVIYARFGEGQEIQERAQKIAVSGRTLRPGQVGEIIPFRQSTALDRWFGFPDWLAAVTSIELVQANHQHFYEFYVNRGVPEFMLFLLGGTVDAGKWAKIEQAMKGHVGLGNSHKSFALNLDDPSIKVQLERLALEGSNDAMAFDLTNNTLALEIVSAHGVPPLLAGIALPGKLGAANELPNAMMAFQALIIGQAQHSFEQTFASTLGNPKKNGGLGLTPDDLRGKWTKDPMTGVLKKEGGLRTILDVIDLGTADTVGRMKEPLATAKANGRDLSAGLKD